MKRRVALGLILALVGTQMAGCASTGDPVDPNATDLSVIVGAIDMSDAPSDLSWVSIKGYGSSSSSYVAQVEDGLFFHVGVKPGSYQVDRFGGLSGLRGLFGSVY